MRSRNRHNDRRQMEAPDLDVTPFMNLMIVLVPVLLMSLALTQTTVIDLDFPAPSDGNNAAEEPEQPILSLEVRIHPDRIAVADQNGVLQTIPQLEDGSHDYLELSDFMYRIKQRVPEKQDATILLGSNTDYQTLVFVMDRIRVYQGELSQPVSLFPNVSLGDLPESSP